MLETVTPGLVARLEPALSAWMERLRAVRRQ